MYTCFIDGACYPQNPFGEMGWGCHILKDKEPVFEFSGHKAASEENSNNVAEYMALAAALNWFYEKEISDAEVTIKGDSILVINQMKKKWKIKNGLYKASALVCKENLAFLTGRGLVFTFQWIPRESNTYADELSKKNQPEEKREFRVLK
jgi:ribonuclease HI